MEATQARRACAGPLLAALACVWLPLASLAQQEVPDPELTDAVSREMSVSNNVFAETLAQDAVSREMTVANNYQSRTLLTDAISREMTVSNGVTTSVPLTDAVSREMTVFNDVEEIDLDFDGVPSDDGDGTSDPCTGAEGEDRTACDDNCPDVANPDQADGDQNGMGDACETPRVVSVLPGANATGVPTRTGIRVTFSEPVDPETFGDTDGDGTSDSFRLLADRTTPVAGEPRLEEGGLVGWFDPVVPLDLQRIYRVELTAGITDVDGNALEPYESAFETAAEATTRSLADEALLLRSEHACQVYGWSVARAGDVNHDGYGDWLVGAPSYSTTNPPCSATEKVGGAVYLHLGTDEASDPDRSALTAPDLIFTAPSGEDFANLGISVAGGEDVDGDGTPDLVLGADFFEDGHGPRKRGRAYLVLFDPADYPGLEDPDTPAAEVAVEAEADAVLLGQWIEEMDIAEQGDRRGDRSGHSVALLPDVNGDGFAEILVGAPEAKKRVTDWPEIGYGYLVYGGALSGEIFLEDAGQAVDGIRYQSDEEFGSLGDEVAAGGDFDADGTADVFVGERPASDGPWGEGYLDLEPDRAGLVEVDAIGSGDAAAHDGRVLFDSRNKRPVANDVAFVGDHDGDGFDDVITHGDMSPFEIVLQYGGAAPESTRGPVDSADIPSESAPATVYTQEDPRPAADLGLASGGDLDGDGHDELLIGDPGYSASATTEPGRLTIVFGAVDARERRRLPLRRVGAEVSGLVYEGADENENAGFAVSGLGDVDGDGSADLIVGAPRKDLDGRDRSGAAYLLIDMPPAESTPSGPDACQPDADCSVIDLAYGSEAFVPAGALDKPTVLEVRTLLVPPEPPPAGKLMLAAARFAPPLDPLSPAPTVRLALREETLDQASEGEELELFELVDGGWAATGIPATVVEQPADPPRFADPYLVAEATIGRLDVFAVFADDADEDGTRDSLDEDRDGDGLENAADNCPDAVNPGQADCDGDGRGDACDYDAVDEDLDGIDDACDNCPATANTGQADADGDGKGDACDPCPADPENDADDDGLCADEDNCPGVSNASQADQDGDGVGDGCEDAPILRVSNRSEDEADFSRIQAAVNAAPKSGTRIEILVGNGPYLEDVVVDRPLSLSFVGVIPDDGTDGWGEPTVDGGSGVAFTLTDGTSGAAHTFSGLTLRGWAGLDASVSTRLDECEIEDVDEVGLHFRGGEHVVRDLLAERNVASGIRVDAAASLELERARFEGTGGAAVDTASPETTISTALVADGGGDGIVVQSGASLVLRYATIADNAAVGLLSLGDVTELSDSIVWGNEVSDLDGVACTVLQRASVDKQCADAPGNLACDPQLDDRFHLGPGSACLEIGPPPESYRGVPCRDLAGGPRLRDHDGDGLAPPDIGAYETVNEGLTPEAVGTLSWLDEVTLSWDPVPSAAQYHVYHDDVSTLFWDDFGPCRDELDADRTDTQLTHNAVPDPGAGWFYLITAESDAGEEGSLGFGSCAERSNYSPCP